VITVAKNMTLRLNDEDEKKLDFIKDNITYSCVYSKGVLYAISFTFELMKKLALDSGDEKGQFKDRLNKKYKIDIADWRFW
jgi:hypothetical protein